MKANVTLDVNPNEIRDVKYVTPQELKAMFADPGKKLSLKRERKRKCQLLIKICQLFYIDVPMTPWFKLICNSFLFKWWDQLDTIESIEADHTIHRLGF